MKEPDIITGLCRRCGREHRIDSRLAREEARALMTRLEREDEFSRFRDLLFAPGGGKMLGVLVCRDDLGRKQILKGFSGQINGSWLWPGWVEPLFDVDAFDRCQREPERAIKALGRKLDRLVPSDPEAATVRAQRRQLSRELMADLFTLYRLPNFRGEVLTLPQVLAGQGVPTGTGDCCGPKLLAAAAKKGLTPLSLCEFFFGDSLSGRKHGAFYPPCRSRCQPILGTMLCGAGQ